MHRETCLGQSPGVWLPASCVLTQHGSEAQGLSFGVWACGPVFCGGEGGGEWVPRVLEGLVSSNSPCRPLPCPHPRKI